MRGEWGFGSSLAFLSFLDRAAINQGARWIARDPHLPATQMNLTGPAVGPGGSVVTRGLFRAGESPRMARITSSVDDAAMGWLSLVSNPLITVTVD
jgi:hypothetical protein